MSEGFEDNAIEIRQRLRRFHPNDAIGVMEKMAIRAELNNLVRRGRRRIAKKKELPESLLASLARLEAQTCHLY